MSFLMRIFNAFRNPVRNIILRGPRWKLTPFHRPTTSRFDIFFEYPSTSDDPRRTKRMVQYADPEHMTTYIGGNKRLPIQWSSWLTHTRPHPPTLEELQADIQRQQRVLMNAAMIETRDREEQEQMARLRAELQREALAPPSRSSRVEEVQPQVKVESGSEVPPRQMEEYTKAKPQHEDTEPPNSPWRTDSDPQPVAGRPVR
ncbi:hypothetical protein BDQ17DRAFT_1538675 [Cyathus striatus]|nr:hypothetical protein BDQ17DRAFT_1538675 [Cyathus striatus]